MLSLCQVSCFTNYCAECHYAECHYAECHYAECHYAECHYAEGCYADCRYAECHYAECSGTSKFSLGYPLVNYFKYYKGGFEYLPTYFIIQQDGLS
jgi:hypothetical protein